MITGVSLSVSSAVTAWSDEFTPDPDTARVLGTAGLVVALTGLTGGAALVAVTTRIAQQARALPTWAVWVSYAVAVLCLSGFWSGGMASVAFALWLIGAVIGVLRAARRTPPAPAVPAQGAPAPEAARPPPAADAPADGRPQPGRRPQPGLRTRRGTVPRGSVSRRREGPAASGGPVHEPRSCSAGNPCRQAPADPAPALRSARVHALRPPR